MWSRFAVIQMSTWNWTSPPDTQWTDFKVSQITNSRSPAEVRCVTLFMDVWNPPNLISIGISYTFSNKLLNKCAHPPHCTKACAREGAQSVFSRRLWALSLFFDICAHSTGHVRSKHSKGQTILPTCTLASTRSFSRRGGKIESLADPSFNSTTLNYALIFAQSLLRNHYTTPH